MDIAEELALFITASEQMLGLAKEGEWDQVMRMESERRPKLESFFSSLPPDLKQQHSNELSQAIETIVRLDQQTITLGSECKTKSAQALQRSRSARQATAAYQQNTKP